MKRRFNKMIFRPGRFFASLSKFSACNIRYNLRDDEIARCRAILFGRIDSLQMELQIRNFIDSAIPQTELVPAPSKSISRIILTELLPEIRPKQVCGRICAYSGPQGVKAISLSHRNARLGANHPLSLKHSHTPPRRGSIRPFKTFKTVVVPPRPRFSYAGISNNFIMLFAREGGIRRGEYNCTEARGDSSQLLLAVFSRNEFYIGEV